MKIGILGGTFDPIHNVHVEMAKAAKIQYNLDKVYLMPSAKLPHKDNNMITDSIHRINMINLAVEELENIEFSDFEMQLDEVTYTAITLEKFKDKHIDDELFFIMGSDSIAAFLSWFQPEKIVSLAKLLVVKRDDESADIMEEKISEIENMFNIEIGVISMNSSSISSSDIRLNKDNNLKNLVPVKVYEYIIEHDLYKDIHINRAWNVNKIIKDLEHVLKPSRMKHTMGVAKTAKEMAESFGVNPNKAYLAGILHDCAKNLDDNRLFNMCSEKNIPVTKFEEKSRFLLHAKIGEYLAENKYGISDKEVLSAIRWHTTGKANMSNLEKIVFCADYIEPNRYIQKNLEFLRSICNKDLDLLTYSILRDTIQYLTDKGEGIEEHTLEAYEYYKKVIEER